MVEAGLGISIVHSLLIKPGRYRVATLPLNVKQSREIGIAVKKCFLPSTITQLFLQHVVDYTKDMGEITVIRHLVFLEKSEEISFSNRRLERIFPDSTTAPLSILPMPPILSP